MTRESIVHLAVQPRRDDEVLASWSLLSRAAIKLAEAEMRGRIPEVTGSSTLDPLRAREYAHAPIQGDSSMICRASQTSGGCSETETLYVNDEAIEGGSYFPSKVQTLLLRAAFLDGDLARDSFQRWREIVDPMALDQTSFRLLPQLAWNLVRLGEGDPYLDRWKGTYRRAFAFNSTLFHAMAPVVQVLSATGIPALVVDEAAVIATVSGESGLRPMGDFVILIPPAEVARAFDALTAFGWRSTVRFSERLVASLRGAPFSGPDGRRIDLQWYLLRENCYPRADEPVWLVTQDRHLGPFGIRVPCTADQLLHVCVDGLQPGVGTRLPWSANAFALCVGGDVDWERLVTETARRRVALPVRTALRWIREHLKASVPDVVMERLEALPVTAAERRELRAKLNPWRPTTGLRIRWAHHMRAAAGRGCGRAATLAGFGPYLQQVWGLAHLGQLPSAVLRRGIERVWERLGRMAPLKRREAE